MHLQNKLICVAAKANSDQTLSVSTCYLCFYFTLFYHSFVNLRFRCNEMRANSQAAYVKLIRNVYGNKLSSYQVKILWLEQFYKRILFALSIPSK